MGAAPCSRSFCFLSTCINIPNVGAKLRRARFQLASSLSIWSRNLASGSGRPAPEMSPAIGGSRALFGARTFRVIRARSCWRRPWTRARISCHPRDRRAARCRPRGRRGLADAVRALLGGGVRPGVSGQREAWEVCSRPKAQQAAPEEERLRLSAFRRKAAAARCAAVAPVYIQRGHERASAHAQPRAHGGPHGGTDAKACGE